MPRKRIKNSLLRDAIADAKSVRETALANAKAALEEAFTPHLTSMLSDRLREQEEGDYDEEDLEELNDPVNADGHGTDEGGRTQPDKIEKSSFTGDQSVTNEELSDAAENDSDLDSSAIATEPTQRYGTSNPKEPAAAHDNSSSIDNEKLQQPAGTTVTEGEYPEDDEYEMGEQGAGEYPAGPEEDEYEMGEQGADYGGGNEYEEDPMMQAQDEIPGDDGYQDQDLDLEAIIRELEADMGGMGGMGGEEEYGDEMVPEGGEYGEEEYEEDPVMEQNDAEVSDGHGPGEGGAKDASATADSTFTQGEGDSQTDPIQEGGYDDEEIDLEEILREIEAEDDDEEEVVTENRKMRGELKEYRDAILYLRSKLNEVNLLNAKLLFTNKLFKAFDMDVSQKMRVVETFDRAATPREAKLVYTTLAETFQSKPVSRKKRGRRSITEGIASRPTGAKTRREGPGDSSTPTILAEGVDLAARMKKLAGIKS